MRRRRLAIVLLTLGTIGGYASGIASLHRCRSHRAAWEAHVAKLCTDAAQGKTPPPSAEDEDWR